MSSPVLTSAIQVRRISTAQTRFGVPVHIHGILTYADRLSSDCFVQDASGGLRVTLAAGQIPPAPGWNVEVSGMAASGGATPSIVEGSITALRPAALPTPVAISPSQLRDPAYQYQRVGVAGVVRSAVAERPGLVTLEIRSDDTTVWAKIPAAPVMFSDEWIDTEVRATGVLAGAQDGARGTAEPILWIAEPRAIEIRRPATPAAALPVTTIRALRALSPTRPPPHRLRIRGARYTQQEGGEALRDESGKISLRAGQAALADNVPELDLVGFLAWENGLPFLDRVSPVRSISDGHPARTPASSKLTTALQIRQLSPGAARLAYPVHLRATVTYFDPENHLLFVQDRTDAIFVELKDKERASLNAGDEVELDGVSVADFAPNVANAHVKVVGHSRLPEPAPGGFESAIRGREDCHWIELGGIVRQVARGGGDTLLTLAWGRDIFKAHVLASPDALASLVDAEVKLRGVCGALFNTKHQMLGIQLFVPGRECIRVLRRPPVDPFALASTPVKDLMHFSGDSDLGHRVRIKGTVTYSNRSGSTWLRDATGGVMIQDHRADGLAAGDQVDVVGFPVIQGYGPALRGAQLKKLQSGPPPTALPITFQDAVKGGFDGQLVQVEGQLVDRLQQPAEQVLTMQAGSTFFSAHLPNGRSVPSLEPGMHLRLSGICSVDVEQSQDLILPRSFRLFLRSPADVTVLSRPPWLTVHRVVPILAGAVFLIMAALAWAALLRKRVRTQTEALHAQTVLLRAAHQKTREALQKARDAESLDQDSKHIVELIARDEPVDLILDHIAEAVSLHSEAAACAILLPSAQGLRVCAVPSLPAGWLEMLEHLELPSMSFSSEFRQPKEFSDNPAWARFVDAQPSTRFQTFCSAPIVVDSSTAGVLAAFFRGEKTSADAQLAVWCNIAALALDRRRLHDQLSYRAQHDTLTGLPNRARVYECLEAEIAAAREDGGLVGVLYVDLDGFKKINDTYGHEAGDVVLREVARRMTHGVRRGDTVGRIGGDEFVVVLPRLARREDADPIAAKIAAMLREPICDHHQRLCISGSVGIGIWPCDGSEPDHLLRSADARMYGAKRRRWYDDVETSTKVCPL